MAKRFSDLTEREILALAISLEEEDGRIYGEFAERMRADFPSTADALSELQKEESEHRRLLFLRYQARFGEHLPAIHRTDVRGFVYRKPVWLRASLSLRQVRREIESMESETRRFYLSAAGRTTDTATRQLLGDLAAAEAEHSALGERLEREQIASGARTHENDSERRIFILQIVQPGLIGLMDGSVSTLAPLFAAAFATRDSRDAFLVGMAAAVGAGISMGFAEALSDDGAISGRGRPWVRGLLCGAMTAVGGIGHTLPFLIGQFHAAMAVAVAVVAVELAVISWIRSHFMDTPFVSAALQVILGGVLVFLAGILIGSS